MLTFLRSPWFFKLDPYQQDLVRLSVYLFEKEKDSKELLSDYSFVVFPFAKAYEGFLKQYLFDLQLIDQATFESKRFRIGRVINPDVHENQKDEIWLYDNLERVCSKDLAQLLWQTWLTCRNKVFHYFPKEAKPLTLEQAGKHLEMISDAMTRALECHIELQK